MRITQCIWFSLLAMIAISAVKSSAQTFIYNAILFIDTSNNAWYNISHWLIKTPYLSIIASNALETFYHHLTIRKLALCVNSVVPGLLLKCIYNSWYGFVLFVYSIFFTYHAVLKITMRTPGRQRILKIAWKESF